MNKRKLGLLALVMMIVFALATACGGKSKEVSLGVTESGSYTNDYFGVSLSFPKEWTFQSAEQMMKLMSAGKDVVAGNDESKKKALDLAQTKTLNLLTASKFPLDSGKPGPSIVSVAEKVSLLQGVKNGKDYLEASKKLLTESKLPYTFQEIKSIKVGGKDMDVMQASIKSGTTVVTQDYYSTIIDGYAFSFILSYVDDSSKAETDKILESVKFK
jgi:hypothetical protein